MERRKWALKEYLEKNYEVGKWFSIEEIVANVKDSNGNPFYTLNTNPKKHDKCIALSTDIKDINWNICDGYKVLIKNASGGVKIADNEQEFEEWKKHELDKVAKKFQYLNNLQWKANRNDTMPLINQADNQVVDPKFVSVYGNTKN